MWTNIATCNRQSISIAVELKMKLKVKKRHCWRKCMIVIES